MSKSEDKQFDFAGGELLLIDKPLGWTSFDVVNKLRWVIKVKTGHSGTLDPLATGLLILATGKYTKKLSELTGLDKEYEGTICLGAVTPSFDRETEISEEFDLKDLTEEQVRQAALAFTGEIEQVPPSFSAIKQKGKRAYDLARKGRKVIMEPRKVIIHSFEILRVELPYVQFRVRCSKGTYIRSLANDLGAELGVGGYLYDLHRTAIGDFRIEDAWKLDELIALLNVRKDISMEFNQDENEQN